MATSKSVKNEKNIDEKIEALLRKTPALNNYYNLEKNLNTGVQRIKLTPAGYKKLTEFFYNQDNINAYNINAYYIERVNDLKKVYTENIEVNGVIIPTKEHTYYKAISSKYAEFELFKAVLDM